MFASNAREVKLTTAMTVPNTQDLIQEVTKSQDVMALAAESRMIL